MSATAAPAPPEARDPLRRLVRLVPGELLASFVIEMVEHALAAPPTAPTPHAPNLPAANGNGAKRPRVRPRFGRPPGRPRKSSLGQGAEVNGATAPAPAATGEHASNGTGRKAAAAFWEAASRIDPLTPWKPAADRLNLNRSVCQDAYKIHTLPPLRPASHPKKLPPPSPKTTPCRLPPRGRRRRRGLAPNPTARHRSARRGARRFADRTDQVHPADARNGAQPPPDADLSKPKRARRSSNRRSRRPSSRWRQPKGNGHSNVEGAQSLASRFWAKAKELSNTPWKLVADRLHANLAICQDAYRLRKLPPCILPK